MSHVNIYELSILQTNSTGQKSLDKITACGVNTLISQIGHSEEKSTKELQR